MAKKWKDLFNRMPADSRAMVNARVEKTLASMPLAEIRKAVGLTQQELAGKLDISQGSVSKVENAADMYLTTLRHYVEAMGGELRLIATFPGGRTIDIDRLGEQNAA